MIADIFYPIFTLTITILACFIQNKIVWGLHTHAFTRASPWTTWVAYSSPQTPSCNHFWLCQKLVRPYFFLYYLLNIHSFIRKNNMSDLQAENFEFIPFLTNLKPLPNMLTLDLKVYHVK